jgi:alkylation response protein AidB-like acyl-CoA dehydrogenase
MPDTDSDMEPVEDFRRRLRAWLPDNMPPAGRAANAVGLPRGTSTDEEELADVARTRQLQRKLFDGGFAGICFPKAYGGQGLSPGHQQAFNEEIYGYDYPARIQVPTYQPCATVLLDFGSEEQKKQHLPAIFKGEEIWMQFLSEPTGGSDVAGAQTTALRDGDEWVLNGSKIWTTGAWWSDWGLCLARTNWDVPKHRGLTVFILRIHQPGIEVHRIEMLNGSKEFCQEFMTDVRIPDSDRIGDVDDGWTVGTRWMFYEKSFGISYYTTRPTAPAGSTAGAAGGAGPSHIRHARTLGRLDDPVTRELIGEAHALSLVSAEANRRVGRAIATGKMSDQGAGLSKVLGGSVGLRLATINFQLAGSSAGVWTDDATSFGERGVAFLTRQAGQIAGGTVEMSRNVVSERLLGMPRERTMDRDVAFRNVPRAAPTR